VSVDKFGVDAEAEARLERLLAKARAQTRDIAFAHAQAKVLVRDAVRLSQKTQGVDRDTAALVLR
jgi:hypothetical protein